MHQVNQPLFETRLSFWYKFFHLLVILFLFIVIVTILSITTSTSWVERILFILFLSFWIIQIIRASKTFHLFSDKLIVRRPLFFSKRTDVVFKLAEINEVIFRRIKYKFGGPHIIIKSKSRSESYRIDLSDETLNQFITSLSESGLKVSTENL